MAPCFSVLWDPLPRDQRSSASLGGEEKKQWAAISASAHGGSSCGVAEEGVENYKPQQLGAGGAEGKVPKKVLSMEFP